MTVVVKGVREISRSFGRVSKEFPKHIRKRLMEAAEPVRSGAEILAGTQVRNLGQGDPWTQMRTGGGVKVVYISAKQRGRTSRHNQRRRRPNMKPILLRAMESSGQQHEAEVRSKVETLLQDALGDWNRG